MRFLAPAMLLLSLAARIAAAQPSDPVSLEQALFVGGAQDEAEMTRLRALYHARIDPIVAVVRDQPPAIAAQLLLRHLHQSYGGTEAVLKAYEIDASSINDALSEGHYNCVAATTLFLLAARDAGLDVSAELYDDHARAVLNFEGRRIQVEATHAYGYDVDDWIIHDTESFRTGPLAIELPRAATTDQLLAAVYQNDLFFGRKSAPSLGARTAQASYFFSSPSAAGFSGRSTSSNSATSTASPAR